MTVDGEAPKPTKPRLDRLPPHAVPEQHPESRPSMSDRLALAHAIEEAGIERAKAEAVATAIARFVEGSAATKADVDHVEAAVKADIARLDAKIGLLDAKVDQIGQRTFNRLGTLMVVVVTLLFGALHLWPPH